MKTPVFVLSGFLGSGKTTLLNALLRRAAFAHSAVIVNEFGEIGLDHLIVARASDTVLLLEGGCLCCTVVDSLHETLAAMHAGRVRGELPSFERVIIETTGLANPGPIVSTLIGHPLVTDHYRLESLVVTVDAQHASSTLDAHPESVKQIALADTLLMTKLDIAPASPELVARLTALNPAAERCDARDTAAVDRAFSPTPNVSKRHRVPMPAVVRPTLLGGVPHGAHDGRLRSHAFVLTRPPSWAGIAAWWRVATERFGERLLRGKGLVEIADSGDIVFLQTVQRVFHTPERLPDWPDADHRSRLVFITEGVEREALASTLKELDADPGTPPA